MGHTAVLSAGSREETWLQPRPLLLWKFRPNAHDFGAHQPRCAAGWQTAPSVQHAPGCSWQAETGGVQGAVPGLPAAPAEVRAEMLVILVEASLPGHFGSRDVMGS